MGLFSNSTKTYKMGLLNYGRAGMNASPLIQWDFITYYLYNRVKNRNTKAADCILNMMQFSHDTLLRYYKRGKRLGLITSGALSVTDRNVVTVDGVEFATPEEYLAYWYEQNEPFYTLAAGGMNATTLEWVFALYKQQNTPPTEITQNGVTYAIKEPHEHRLAVFGEDTPIENTQTILESNSLFKLIENERARYEGTGGTLTDDLHTQLGDMDIYWGKEIPEVKYTSHKKNVWLQFNADIEVKRIEYLITDETLTETITEEDENGEVTETYTVLVKKQTAYTEQKLPSGVVSGLMDYSFISEEEIIYDEWEYEGETEHRTVEYVSEEELEREEYVQIQEAKQLLIQAGVPSNRAELEISNAIVYLVKQNYLVPNPYVDADDMLIAKNADGYEEYEDGSYSIVGQSSSTAYLTDGTDEVKYEVKIKTYKTEDERAPDGTKEIMFVSRVYDKDDDITYDIEEYANRNNLINGRYIFVVGQEDYTGETTHINECYTLDGVPDIGIEAREGEYNEETGEYDEATYYLEDEELDSDRVSAVPKETILIINEDGSTYKTIHDPIEKKVYIEDMQQYLSTIVWSDVSWSLGRMVTETEDNQKVTTEKIFLHNEVVEFIEPQTYVTANTETAKYLPMVPLTVDAKRILTGNYDEFKDNSDANRAKVWRSILMEQYVERGHKLFIKKRKALLADAEAKADAGERYQWFSYQVKHTTQGTGDSAGYTYYVTHRGYRWEINTYPVKGTLAYEQMLTHAICPHDEKTDYFKVFYDPNPKKISITQAEKDKYKIDLTNDDQLPFYHIIQWCFDDLQWAYRESTQPASYRPHLLVAEAYSNQRGRKDYSVPRLKKYKEYKKLLETVDGDTVNLAMATELKGTSAENAGAMSFLAAPTLEPDSYANAMYVKSYIDRWFVKGSPDVDFNIGKRVQSLCWSDPYPLGFMGQINSTFDLYVQKNLTPNQLINVSFSIATPQKVTTSTPNTDGGPSESTTIVNVANGTGQLGNSNMPSISMPSLVWKSSSLDPDKFAAEKQEYLSRAQAAAVVEQQRIFNEMFNVASVKGKKHLLILKIKSTDQQANPTNFTLQLYKKKYKVHVEKGEVPLLEWAYTPVPPINTCGGFNKHRYYGAIGERLDKEYTTACFYIIYPHKSSDNEDIVFDLYSFENIRSFSRTFNATWHEHRHSVGNIWYPVAPSEKFESAGIAAGSWRFPNQTPLPLEYYTLKDMHFSIRNQANRFGGISYQGQFYKQVKTKWYDSIKNIVLGAIIFIVGFILNLIPGLQPVGIFLMDLGINMMIAGAVQWVLNAMLESIGGPAWLKAVIQTVVTVVMIIYAPGSNFSGPNADMFVNVASIGNACMSGYQVYTKFRMQEIAEQMQNDAEKAKKKEGDLQRKFDNELAKVTGDSDFMRTIFAAIRERQDIDTSTEMILSVDDWIEMCHAGVLSDPLALITQPFDIDAMTDVKLGFLGE